ncbi:hypothetical protein EV283_2472 [Sphingomonas sp. BK036]|uniref:hypothetical protein n=1 Tax=Sphingomonas sp. BK036 TaxID=2512122 RepID=UPI0010DFA6DD|nr:hypothetical protein [Sphingomonas sp. BK036]RZT53221.1 hypothetical protein EV283_2472 [Sphingomonas sp. BK036]
MRGEFEASIADGEPLPFALGCLLAAWRARLADPDGRLALARYLLVVGLILPLAVGAIVGFPYLDFAQGNVVGILAVGGAPSTLLDDGNRAAASSLSMVVFLLASMSVRIAWSILDRNWVRVAAIERFAGAATLTLMMVVGLLGFDETRMILPIPGFVAQHVVVLMLMQWHLRLDWETATAHYQD